MKQNTASPLLKYSLHLNLHPKFSLPGFSSPSLCVCGMHTHKCIRWVVHTHALVPNFQFLLHRKRAVEKMANAIEKASHLTDYVTYLNSSDAL